MAKITIKGSLSPAAPLARDEVRTVQDSPDVRAYVAAGFADIVDEETGEAEPPAVGTGLLAPIEPPARNASREDWAEWMAAYTDVVTEGKDRTGLIEEFDEWVKTHDLPTASE